MPEPTTRRIPGWLVPAGILLISALLLALVVLQARDAARSGSGPEAESEAGLIAVPPQNPDLMGIERRDADDVEAAGSLHAPVSLVVFSDYQCPFCAKWNRDSLPRMMEYAEAGTLRIEWRDINMYGDPSERAALAAHAAGLQDHYWDYHDVLFAGGQHRAANELTDDALVEIAEHLGLDTDRFVADMHSDSALEQIDAAAGEGRELGITGTPTFILDGRAIVGAQPDSVFTDIIDHALAQGE